VEGFNDGTRHAATVSSQLEIELAAVTDGKFNLLQGLVPLNRGKTNRVALLDIRVGLALVGIGVV